MAWAGPLEAIELYDQILAAYPDYARNDRVLYQKARAYDELGQHQRAIGDLDEAIRLDPQYAPAYSNRGLAYSQLGQYQRAIEDCDQALRLDPQYALVYSNRALAYTALGRDQEAERDIEKAVELGFDADPLRRQVEQFKAHRQRHRGKGAPPA